MILFKLRSLTHYLTMENMLKVTTSHFLTPLLQGLSQSWTQKSNPLQWMKFSNPKLAINLLLMCGHATRLGTKLRGNNYINDRCPGHTITMDTSRLRKSRSSFLSHLQCLRTVQFDWTNGISAHTNCTMNSRRLSLSDSCH